MRRLLPLLLLLLAPALPAAAQPRVRRLPLLAEDRATAQRPHRGARAVPLAGPRRLLHRGARGLAQRGGARQDGLRSLLRAHDVQGHEEAPRGRARAHPRHLRLRRQRLHHRRLHRLPLVRPHRRARRRSSSWRRTASATSSTPSPRSAPRRSRCSASTTRTRSRPELKMEEHLLGTAFQKHTYRHTTIGFYEDIQGHARGLCVQPHLLRALVHPGQQPPLHRRRLR